jgi:hypothetical protein
MTTPLYKEPETAVGQMMTIVIDPGKVVQIKPLTAMDGLDVVKQRVNEIVERLNQPPIIYK